MLMEAIGMGAGRLSLSLNLELPNWCQLLTSQDFSAVSLMCCSVFLFKVAPRIYEIQVIAE